MSKIFSGILGVLAVSVSLGAAQYASGSDLVGLARQSTAVATAPEAAINRQAKADRANAPANALQTRTISVSVDAFPDPSILVRGRVPRKNPRNSPPAPAVSKQPVAR